MTAPDLAAALANADLVHDRAVIERAVDAMALRIRNDYRVLPSAMLKALTAGSSR